MYILDDILKQSVSAGASDIHFSVGRPPYYRIDGVLSPAGEEPLMPRELSDLLLGILDEAHRQELGQTGQTDLAYAISGVGRFRVNIFRQRGTYAAAMRCLPFTIPDADSLHIPPQVQGLTEKRRGLVLVTGPTGSGKSTTLASLVDIINRNYPYHIITLEDPIEYLHRHQKSIVNQREIGSDSQNYAQALRAALREDPDVILVGEMRDLETISTALTAAIWYFPRCIPSARPRPLTGSSMYSRRISSSRCGSSWRPYWSASFPSSSFRRQTAMAGERRWRFCLPIPLCGI